MGIWITVACKACGGEHRLGHCPLERNERQRAYTAAGGRRRVTSGQRPGPDGVTAGVTRYRGNGYDGGMPTPVYPRCPDCQRMHAAGECRLAKRGLGEAPPTAQAAVAVASSVKPAPAPQQVAARVKAARQAVAEVDGDPLMLPAGVAALVRQQAAGADPVELVERAVRAYAQGGGKGPPMTAAEKQRAYRERQRAKRLQGGGDAA